MKINNLTPNNQTIGIKEISLDFSSAGIYLIIGDTGSGKTSVIKQILFDSKGKEIAFDRKDEEKLFQSNKNQLVSYVPQDILVYEETVASYLNLNRLKGTSKLEEYMCSFNLDKDLLKVTFNKLSGGEKRKLAIIRALLKDTPYIFLDEPTNDMDNAAVVSLKKILQSLAQDHTIILISHDKRLFDISDKTYNFKQKRIEQIIYNKGEADIKEKAIKRKRGSNLLTNTRFSSKASIRNRFTLIKAFLLFSFILTSFFTGEKLLMRYYNTEGLPEKNNLFIYTGDGVFNDLNKKYLKESHIDFPANKVAKVNFSNIPEISKKIEVDKIFYPDGEYLDKLVNDFLENKTSMKHVISIPSFLTTGPNLIMFPFDIKGVIKGRLPEDFKNEIALSKNMYAQLSGNASDNFKIDSTIDYLGVKYKVVGEANSDIAILSMNLDDSKNIGYHLYSDATFKAIADRSVQFYKDLQYNDYTSINHILIKTKGSEKKVLDALIKQFPANNYYSYSYVKAFKQSKNRPLYLGAAAISLILGLLMALIFNMLEKNTLTYIAKIIKDQAYYDMNMKSGVSKYLKSYYKYIVISGALAVTIIWLVSIFKLISIITAIAAICIYIIISYMLNLRIFREVK